MSLQGIGWALLREEPVGLGGWDDKGGEMGWMVPHHTQG